MRALNPLECLKWSLGEAAPYNIVIEAEGVGKIDPTLLIQAVEELHTAHVALSSQVSVDRELLCFSHQAGNPTPFYINSEASALHELNTPFQTTTYLYRVTLKQQEECFWIYLTLHHLIGDGKSALALMQELLLLYDQQEISAKTTPIDWFSKLPIKPSLRTQPPGFAAACGTPKTIEGNTAYISYSTENSAPLLNSCKKQGVGIQSTLTALMLAALRASTAGQLMPQRLLSHHLIDMRPRLSPPLQAHPLQCVISQLAFHLDRDKEAHLWEQAKLCSHYLSEALNQDLPTKTLESVSQGLSLQGTFARWKENSPLGESTLCITNFGQNKQLTLSSTTVTNITPYVTMHGIYTAPSLMLVANSYGEHVNLQLHYSDQYYQREHITECMTLIGTLIENM